MQFQQIFVIANSWNCNSANPEILDWQKRPGSGVSGLQTLKML